MKSCYNCSAVWGDRTQPGFRATCDDCGMYWHCCRNCRFHDTTQPNECRIPNIELVAEKEKANFCEEFTLAERDETGVTPSGGDGAKHRFDALFGDG